MDERAWVLVVDDEDTVLKLMATVLLYAGYRVTTACDAHSAQLQCQDQAPNLLICDILLHPDYTGCELARNLRVTYPNLKALFVSGMAEGELTQSECAGNELAEKEIREGRAAFLAKPFSPRLLADTVASLLPVGQPTLPSLIRF